MKAGNISNRIILVSVLFTLVTLLRAQVPTTESGFVPEVGQQGKDVVWVPTPNELVDAMLRMAKVTPDDYVIDLGSGDGRTVIAAAKIGATALGIEYNPDMVALSKRHAEQEGVSAKANFIEADLYEYDFSKATVITMFLLPEINLKLRPRLLDLKPGTRIVSNTFTMGEWEPDYEVTTEENWNSWNKAMMWIIPAKVEGFWMLGQNELSFKQQYQMVFGNLISNSKVEQITDGRLNGNEITFKIKDDLYVGQVNGKTMSGTVTGGGKKSDWVATKTGN
ncbi:MAG: class I SAM-dependent methyltransferase [Bacteroidales bacterium]|jgi:SAM-dependent methyltransferase|nr:class I SAM-dependent methyltransferase [Bacteroidales bacterium]